MERPDDTMLPTSRMPALQATAMVGTGSVVTLALSVLTMKAYALLIGPDGVGVLALMQSIVNIGLIVTGLGISTTVIGVLAGALARNDHGSANAIVRVAITLSLAGGLVGVTVLGLFRVPVAEFALGRYELAGDVLILAPCLLLATAAGVQIALLTGRHLISRVTTVNIATAAVAAASGIALVAMFGVGALAPTLLVTYAAQLLFATAAGGRIGVVGASWAGGRAVTGNLLKRGLPVAGSQLAGTGVTFLVPILVLQTQDAAAVGLYRAAASLSIGYLTFFVAGLIQDYLPRLGAAPNAQARKILVERRMRLVMGLAVPIILGLLAVGPWLVEWLYSDEFARSYDVLRWQLVGDLLRLPAWVLTFVLIARGIGPAYLGVEVIGGIAVVGATLAGLSLFGLEGAGMGYFAAQALYLAVVWVVVRRYAGTTPGRLQAAVAICAALCTAVVLIDVSDIARLLLFGAGAVLVAAVAWPRLYHLNASGDL